ncbi:MAG: heme-binding domain-containing protein [Bacteroidota bacterium]
MKKLTLKNIGLGLLAILLLIQFVPGDKNTGNELGPNHISTLVIMPDSIQHILHTSCSDCHSNATSYPWYSNIQPVRLWLDHHVDEGKHELNFSEFATYKKKRQLHKLDEMVEMIEEHEMPLSSYTLIHTDAVLSPEQQTTLINWAKETKRALKDSTAHLQ